MLAILLFEKYAINMTNMKLLPDRTTVYFNPEETPEILRRYTTVGRLLQAATEMEFLMHCWIEALLRDKGSSPPSSRQTNNKDFPELWTKLLNYFEKSNISIEISTRIIEAMKETEYLMKVRNIVCHNPLVTGDTGIPKTRSSWKKTGNIIINQATLEEIAYSFRRACNALYEGYRDTYQQAPYTANPTKWTKLDNDLS